MYAVDLHCDALLHLNKRGDLEQTRGMVTLDGLQRGNVALECFAAFVPTGKFPKFCRDALSNKMFDSLYRRYGEMLARYPERLFPILSTADLDSVGQDGRTGVLLTIEDGGVLGDQLENVAEFYQKGVRLVTLTWNTPNPIGFPNSNDPAVMEQGLTPFGRAVVQEMERLGMVVDVSHASDGVFWEVAQMAKKPFVASHSNARAICPHSRNLTDEMIRTLADCGGVMGLNLGPEFLTPGGKESRLADMVRHILHIRNVGGSGVLALGSDFDGIHGSFEVSGPQDWQKLWDALKKAGLTEGELEQMWSQNALRVLRDVL